MPAPVAAASQQSSRESQRSSRSGSRPRSGSRSQLIGAAAGGAGGGGKVTPRKTTPRKARSRKEEKSSPSREKERVDLTSAALAVVADRQEELAQEYEKACSSPSTFSSKLGEAVYSRMVEGMRSSDVEKLIKSHDGKVSSMNFEQTMRDLGVISEATDSGYTSTDSDALFAELGLDDGCDLELLEVTRTLKRLSLRAAQVRFARA